MRLRFLSPDKHKHHIARLVGAILFFVGGTLLFIGVESEDIFLYGLLLLVWYGMSWVAYRKNPDKPLHIIQEIFCFLLFSGISVILGVIAVYLPKWITHAGLGILIDFVLIVLFLVLLFARGGSSKKEPKS